MKQETFSTWLAILLFGLIAAIPILPLFRETGSSYHFEYEVISRGPGFAQVYWNGGNGYAEVTSSRAMFRGEAKPETVRLRIPSGRYQSFRFDPNDRPNPVAILNPRITDPEGRVVRRFTAVDFVVANQIERLVTTANGLEIVFSPGANDPQTELQFKPDLKLKLGRYVALVQWLTYGGMLFAALAIARLAWRRLPGLSGSLPATLAWLQRKPWHGLAAMAALATLVSTYPVWLLGRSFVSPNNGGAALLYESMPTLPGDRDSRIYDAHGSDVGAIMWAHIPYSRVHVEALKQGTVPAWNRYNSAGTSLLGQGQSMFGDPTLALVYLTDGAAWAWDLRYLVGRWMFTFGLGACTWLLVRHLASAHLVTFAAAFLGFFTYRLNHPAYFSMCYGPGVLFAWLWLVEATERRQVAQGMGLLAFTNLLMINSGTVKEAYMLLFTLNFAGGVYALLVLENWIQRLRRLVAAVLALALFSLLSAPTWAVFLAQLRSSYTSYNLAHTFQIQTGMLLGFFDELFYRPLTQLDRVFNPSVNFVVFAGLAYLVATLHEALASRRIVALLVGSLPPAALALGLVPPEWIIHTPFLANVAHVDNSFSCALIILVTLLSGFGFAHAAKNLGTARGARDLCIGGLFVGAIVWMWISFGQAVHRSVFGYKVTFSPLQTGHELTIDSFVWWSLVALLAALSLGGVAFHLARRAQRWAPWQAYAVALSLLVCLWRLGVHTEAVGFPRFTLHFGERPTFGSSSRALDAVRATQSQEPSRAHGLKGNLFPGWNAYTRIEGINGPDALIIPEFRELTGASPLTRIWDWRLYVEPPEVEKVRPFLDFLNVRYYLDFQSDQGLLGRVLRPVAMADLDVYESPTVWPRAFYTDQVLAYDDPKVLVEQIMTSAGQPFAGALRQDLEAGTGSGLLAELAQRKGPHGSRPARDYELSANGTRFTVDAPGAGVAVLSETYSRGDLRATVDGQPVDVLRINHAFRGVLLETPGTHVVEIWYHPRGLTLGLILFCLGLVASTALVLFYRKLPLL